MISLLSLISIISNAVTDHLSGEMTAGRTERGMSLRSIMVRMFVRGEIGPGMTGLIMPFSLFLLLLSFLVRCCAFAFAFAA